jgi:hypothetical protein
MEKEFISSIEKLLNRDLQKLKTEIDLYPSDELLWKIEGPAAPVRTPSSASVAKSTIARCS